VIFAAITLCVASQRVFIVVIVFYFVIDSVRKLLDTPSYVVISFHVLCLYMSTHYYPCTTSTVVLFQLDNGYTKQFYFEDIYY
jgi:hypothetical protein